MSIWVCGAKLVKMLGMMPSYITFYSFCFAISLKLCIFAATQRASEGIVGPQIMKATYIRPQMCPFSLSEESIIAASGFIKAETENIIVDPNEKHDPSESLSKDNSFDLDW